jgi:diamine N-acetyltransferase
MMIQSKNLRLRAPEPTDIETIYLWENDVEIWHLSNTLTPYSRFAIEQFVMNTDHDIFAARQLRLMIDLILDEAPITIGSIDLFEFDPFHSRAGVGILIDKPLRNQGYATEALALIIDYAFNTLRLHQLFCNIEADNTKSINLFTKAGFVKTGIKKEWLYRDGKWIDELLFQLIVH